MKFFKKIFDRLSAKEEQTNSNVDMMEKNKEVANMLLPKIQEVLDEINEKHVENFQCEGKENYGEYSFCIKHEGEAIDSSPLQLDINVDNIGQELHSHYANSDDMYFSVDSIDSFLKQGVEDRLVEGK